MATLAQHSPAVTIPTPSLRSSGWFFILAPLCFIVVILVAVVGGMAGPGPGMKDLAEAQAYLAPLAVTWTLIWLLSTLPYVIQSAGFWTVAKTLRASTAATILGFGFVLALLGTGLRIFLAYLNIGLLFNAPLVAGQTLNQQGAPLGWRGLQPTADLLILAAVFCLALGLFSSGTLRKTGLIVAALSAAALLVQTLFMVTANLDGLPPIVSALLALPLGIGLVRQRPA